MGVRPGFLLIVLYTDVMLHSCTSCRILHLRIFVLQIYCVEIILPRIVKRREMGRTHSTNGRDKNAYEILVGRRGRETTLERCKCRWEDNIKIGLKETVW